MKTLKQLKEEQNELLVRADEFLKVVTTEKRALTDEEDEELKTIETEIRALSIEIEALQAGKKTGTKINSMEENRNMDKEKEIRGLEQYLRRQQGEEVRELNTTADGGAVIPEHVEGTIVEKMAETSDVFARARKFPSVSGSLKIAKESQSTEAGFVGEGSNLLEGKVSFEEVKLNQKRVGAAITLSNQLVHDSAVPIVDYAMNLLARRAAKAVEKSILVGTKDDEFRGIVSDTEISKVEVESTVTVDDLMDLYNSVHAAFLDKSAFIMSRKFFNQVAKLKDGNGHFYLQNGVINGKLSYTLFGAEVVVTDALTDETPALFGSVEDAYAVLVKRGLALQHITGDTTQALRGSQMLVLDAYMDGAVYNPQAISKLVVSAPIQE